MNNPQPQHPHPGAREWALRYTADRGMFVVPVPYMRKGPVLEKWQGLRLTVEDIPGYFNGNEHNQNIGILLGVAQEGCEPYVDVDLDCKEAARLAPRFLPPTGAIFGRKSHPASHWLYTCPDAPTTLRYQDTVGGVRGAVLVELRGLTSGGSVGIQTIAPGSVRGRDPSKDPPDYRPEPIEWCGSPMGGEAASVEQAALADAVSRLAAAALLVRHYPAGGGRHHPTLALAGGLLHAGWTPEDVRHFVQAVAEGAGDEKLGDRLAEVNSTAAAFDAGRNVTGWPTLADMVGEQVVKRVQGWLGVTGVQQQTAPAPVPPPSQGALGAEGPVASDGGEPLTDMGNAERLVRYFGDRIRHSAELGWVCYDGKHWVHDGAPVREFAKQTVRLIYGEAQQCADEGRRTMLGKHATRSEAVRAIDAMLKLAETDALIVAHPADFDRNPWYLNCMNGTLDLRTGGLLDHDPAHLISQLSPVVYDAQATCPAWERFVTDVFAGSDGVAAFMQRAVGYSLTGDTREQVWFLLYGSGSNGKGTFLNTLRAVFGSYAQHATTEMLLASRMGGIPNDLAQLPGVRFLTAIESEEGRRLAESLVKQLTGGDPVRARFLQREFFEFVPVLKLFFATNHRPHIRGTDHATWRRLLTVPFTNTWYKADEAGEPKRDEALPARLTAELPGILRWAVLGCQEWLRIGLQPPDAVAEATKGYRKEEDRLGTFLDEACECFEDIKQMSEADVLASGLSATAKELYQAFGWWCDEAGETAGGKPFLTKTALGLALAERGFISKRGTGNVAMWYGLKVVAGALRGG